MRVTDNMMNELVTTGMQARREEYFEAQQVASTGLRVNAPSDDPAAASQARETRSIERRASAVMNISDAAIDQLQQVDETLGQVGDVLSQARALAIQGANDSMGAADRATIADDVAALRQQLLSLANTRIDGEYVFGGIAVDAPPFDTAGNYTGAPTLREIEVGPGLRLPTQLSGEDIFGTAPGAVNAFTTLDNLETVLRADDSDAIHSALDDLGTLISQGAAARADAGNSQRALLQARAVAERARDEAVRRRSRLTETNSFDAFSDLMKAETALREAIAIAARMPPPSLAQVG